MMAFFVDDLTGYLNLFVYDIAFHDVLISGTCIVCSDACHDANHNVTLQPIYQVMIRILTIYDSSCITSYHFSRS